ncbi:MAG: 2-C-methyl-D-erythritol 4-phosphate cytidylyltransferase, partial [Pseudomonadota bacterium]
MKIDALIVAAGRGTRLGSETPKQYLMLDGKMLLTRTVEALLACDAISMVRCVISPEARALYDAAIAPIRDPRLGPPVDGGADRAGSVRRGLEAMVGDAPDRVLIHDAARPFVTPTALEALCRAKTAAILAEPVVDALWRDADGHADAPVPRAGLWRAQTPQAFPFEGILAAHRAPVDPDKPALDDAETYRRAGGEVALITGEPDNFKITTSADFERARRMAAVEAHREAGDDQMETRIGHGYDTHRFVDGDAVWLCGVRIAHDKALSGHSDA